MVVLTSFTRPTEGIRHRQNNTTAYVNDINFGKGTLYIAESCLSWVSDSGSGFSIRYPHISLHAVSRDLSAFPQECLFVMLDAALQNVGMTDTDGENNDENENDSDEQETTELRLVPDDRGMLDAMFHAMNACQALHPDPEDSFSDEDFFEDDEHETPMEEAYSQMANLRIESTVGRQHMLGTGVCMEAMADKEEDTEVGTKRTLGGRGVGRAAADMTRISAVGRVANMAGVGMIRTSEGRGVGISGGRGVGISEGILEDRVGGISGRACILVGRGVGRAMDMEEEDSISALDMAQDDRSFSSENMLHQDRSAWLLAAHSPRMDLEEDSNFVDAEN